MEFHQPATLAEALAIKGKYGADAYFLAGGTDLVVLRNRGRVKGQHWIDLSRLGELNVFDEQDGVVSIGSGCPHVRLESSRFVALAEAAASVGGPQIRHRGTVGGNVGNASPAGDVSVALLAHNATVSLANGTGSRSMLLNEFFLAPGKTAIAPDEIITGFTFPASTRSAWFKLGKREATAISVVCTAVGRATDGAVYIALGSVGPRPLRVAEAEALIAERGLNAETALAAGQVVRECIKPITDQRASADYRRDVAGTMVARLLARLADTN